MNWILNITSSTPVDRDPKNNNHCWRLAYKMVIALDYVIKCYEFESELHLPGNFIKDKNAIRYFRAQISN